MHANYRDSSSAPTGSGPHDYPGSPMPLAAPRRRRWPYVLAAAGVVVGLVAVGTVLLLGRDSRFVFGTASIDSGTAEFRTGSEAGFELLSDGASLRSGDVLRTGEGAGVTLSLADGSLLRLGEATEAAFEESEPGKAVLRLVEGNAWYRHTPTDASLTIGVATKTAALAGRTGVAALDCAAGGACTVQAIAGAIDLLPDEGDAYALAPAERVSLDEQGRVIEVIQVRDDSENPAWVIENQEADEAAGLASPPAPEDRSGVLARARVQGAWGFELDVTESTADNFTVGEPTVFDIDLASSCSDGPCEFVATFDRYTGTGSQAEDGTVAFNLGAPLRCVNTASGAVTVADNGPENLTFDLQASAAEVRESGLVVTALVGTARYEKDARGPCQPGDQVGPAFAIMDVTGTLS